ncbi:MAG: MarR family winged helix-turn-helix transcriptional regulator [Peptococcaceae bacterium]
MDPLGENLGTRMAVIRQLFSLRKKIFKDISCFMQKDLSLTEAMVLMVIKDKNYQVMELAAEVGLPASTLTGILDRLVKKGMVERFRNDEDRRVVIIGIGEGFKEKKQYYQLQIKEYVESLGDELSDDWWVMMQNELEKFNDVVEKRG